MTAITIFAATRQEKPTKFEFPDGAVWETGVQPPFGEITNSEYLRGFDVRHAELIFKLLAFFRENDINVEHRVDMSYYKLLKIIGWKRSKQNLEKVKDVLGDLCSIWIKITRQEKCFAFRVLETLEEKNVGDGQNEILKNLGFDHSFLDHIEDVELFKDTNGRCYYA